MSAATTLLVRLVHIVGMVLVLGGAASVWVTFRVGGPGYADADDPTASGSDQTPFAALYELALWAAMGAMIVTGADNLGTPDPPGPSGRWGSLLTAKLLVVTAFVLKSFVRMLVVFRPRRGGPTGLGRLFLAKSYGAIAAVPPVLVVFAEVLVHG